MHGSCSSSALGRRFANTSSFLTIRLTVIPPLARRGTTDGTTHRITILPQASIIDYRPQRLPSLPRILTRIQNLLSVPTFLSNSNTARNVSRHAPYLGKRKTFESRTARPRFHLGTDPFPRRSDDDELEDIGMRNREVGARTCLE